MCQSCGDSSARWFGKCPSCGEWNSCIEEKASSNPGRGSVTNRRAELSPITNFAGSDHERIDIGIGEFNRVLGNGMVPGSVVLVGGDPGIGKSTLLLQMAGRLAVSGRQIVYVSAEESNAQIRMRAARTDSLFDDLLVLSETNIGDILERLRASQPSAVIVDSISRRSTRPSWTAPLAASLRCESAQHA